MARGHSGTGVRATPRRSLTRLVSAMAVCAALVAGCTTHSDHDAEGQHGRTAATSPTGVPAADPAATAVATADRLARSYDYDGALAALAGVSGDAVTAKTAEVRAAKAKAVPWPDNTTIPHVFYHSLVVDPRRAFAAPNGEGVGFSQYMATVSEFKAQLAQMHARGYVLVHPQRIAAKGPDGTMRMQPIVLPPGKKPLVLSLDDLSYYEYMTGKGFANLLVAKPDGRVVNTYTDASGKTVEGAFDCVPIIDDFVRQHPDFAYRGDKGSIAMTGYNGVLGYRTSVRKYGDTPATRAAQAKAKVVADRMKKNGWHFASHSWGHINMTRSGVSLITADAERWDREVRPILGDTDELIYPFGADVSDARPYSAANPKVEFLHGVEKFDYFFGVDGTSDHWVQLGPTTLRQSRINVDGITLQRALDGKRTSIVQFFDPKPTIDKDRPLPVPSIGGPVAGG